MFERLQQRADAAGRTVVGPVCARLAAQADVPPGVTVTARPDGVALEGRALKRRMLDDPRLRSIGL